MSELEAKVFTVVAGVLKLPVEEVNIDARIDETRNWDSLTNMHILLSIEDAFDISFNVCDLSTFNSCQSIIGRIREMKE